VPGSKRRQPSLAGAGVVGAVRAAGEGGARATAQEAVHTLRAGYETAPYRPSGPAVRDRAYVALVEGLERLVALEPGAVGGPTDEHGAVLRAATAEYIVLSAPNVAPTAISSAIVLPSVFTRLRSTRDCPA